jgi:hypothetical protein
MAPGINLNPKNRPLRWHLPGNKPLNSPGARREWTSVSACALSTVYSAPRFGYVYCNTAINLLDYLRDILELSKP